MSFTARFPGRCPDCGEAIAPGDVVEYDDRIPARVVHVDCDDTAPAPSERPVAVCDRCWLTKPCACDDLDGAA